MHAHRVRKNNDTRPTPDAHNYSNLASYEMFGRPAVIFIPDILCTLISHHPGRPNSERRENVRQPTVAVIIEELWVAHGRLSPEMNQHLRVPLRQRYVLILDGGDSPDPFSITRWNSTQETLRGSDYELIVEETERMMVKETCTIPGPRHNNARQEDPNHIISSGIILHPAWLASWSNCQPNYEDGLKNPSQPPVLYVSTIYLDHLAPEPRGDVRVREIRSS